jgi:uncharacterized protein (DUF1684 family)
MSPKGRETCGGVFSVQPGEVVSELDLLDWKRRIFDLYAGVRSDPDPERAWQRWCDVRDDLFAHHVQSPIPVEQRRDFGGVRYYDYDPSLRVTGAVHDAPREQRAIATSGDVPYSFTRFARVRFELIGETRELDLYWLDGYGGGVFLSLADATSNSETYGGGRYLLDTVKGSDLGMHDGELVLDFNFAYNPSCSYDPRWVCPLVPPGNRLAVPLRAGERL